MCNFILTISGSAKEPHALLAEDSGGTEQICCSYKIQQVLQAAMNALVNEDQTGLLLKDPCRRLVPKDQWNDDDVVSGDGEVWIPRDHLALILNVLKES